MNHYFHDNKHLKSNRKEFSFRFWCFDYLFMSDYGVFAKNGIDLGSKLLLEAIKSVGLSSPLLDLGCGYGTVGIILKKEYPEADVYMSDINSRAVELSMCNATNNEVDVHIVQSDMFDEIHGISFHTIALNPPIHAGKKVIYEMFKQSYDHLVKGGQLFVVIRKSHGANSAQAYLASFFESCEVVLKSQGFQVLLAKRH